MTTLLRLKTSTVNFDGIITEQIIVCRITIEKLICTERIAINIYISFLGGDPMEPNVEGNFSLYTLVAPFRCRNLKTSTIMCSRTSTKK